MQKSTYVFPEEVIKCNRGDYVIIKNEKDLWTANLVEEVVLVSRLVALKFPHGIEFMEEKDVLDTAREEMCLLVSSYARDFASSAEAIESIKRKDLGSATSAVCIRVGQLTSNRAVVFRPTLIESK